MRAHCLHARRSSLHARTRLHRADRERSLAVEVAEEGEEENQEEWALIRRKNASSATATRRHSVLCRPAPPSALRPANPCPKPRTGSPVNPCPSSVQTSALRPAPSSDGTPVPGFWGRVSGFWARGLGSAPGRPPSPSSDGEPESKIRTDPSRMSTNTCAVVSPPHPLALSPPIPPAPVESLVPVPSAPRVL